jgi:hypothetical protein
MTYNENSLAMHFLLDNSIYGQMLPKDQQLEVQKLQAQRLAQKAQARQEYEAMVAAPSPKETADPEPESRRIATDLTG